MEALTVVADYGDQCGEEPVWDADKQPLLDGLSSGASSIAIKTLSARHEVVKQGVSLIAARPHEGWLDYAKSSDS